ncbi:hypothetical protein ACOMHN_037248 [Nucella lapillus]
MRCFTQTSVLARRYAMNYFVVNDIFRYLNEVYVDDVGHGVAVQVYGQLSTNGQPMRCFTQTSVLARRYAMNYFVVNDIFRYLNEVFHDEHGPEGEEAAEEKASENGGEDEPVNIQSVEEKQSEQEGEPVNNGTEQEQEVEVPKAAEPETVEPETVEPETVEQPESVEPESVEPETVEPETAEPETAEPDSVEQPECGAKDCGARDCGPREYGARDWSQRLWTQRLRSQRIRSQRLEPENTEPDTVEPETAEPENTDPETRLKPETVEQPETAEPEIVEQPETVEPAAHRSWAEVARGNPTSECAGQSAPFVPASRHSSKPSRPSEEKPASKHKVNPSPRGDSFAGRLGRSPGSRHPDSHQLFIGNIPHHISESELKVFFQRWGKCCGGENQHKNEDSKLPYFGFVVFESATNKIK